MKARLLIGFSCLVLLSGSTLIGQTKTRFVVLAESAADQVKHFCSRPSPPKFDGAWKPTEADIKAMESRLPRIAELRTESGIVGVQIKHPARYYRQYVGILIEKRKYIFINAFCDDTPPEYWRERIVDVCDGGCSWGVVYDIEAAKFSHLEMNGIG